MLIETWIVGVLLGLFICQVLITISLWKKLFGIRKIVERMAKRVYECSGDEHVAWIRWRGAKMDYAKDQMDDFYALVERVEYIP